MAVYVGKKIESAQGELLRCYTPTPSVQRYVRSFLFYCAPTSFLLNRRVLHIPTGDSWLCLHPWGSKLAVKHNIAGGFAARMALIPLCSMAQIPITSMVSEDPFYACLFIRLRPWALSTLFPDVRSKSKQFQYDVQSLLSGFWLNAYNQAAATGEVFSFIHFIDGWLQGKISHVSEHTGGRLETICCYSEQQRGELSVEQLAQRAAMSYRTLHRLFVRHLGVCPKMYLRILRFKYACRLLLQGHRKQKTQLAYQCGYYDQPHFNHEFRQVLAFAPEHFVRFIKQHCQLPFWLLLN